MDKEEYYNRIEKINNRFKTDRVSADEEYQLVCQRNYLSTKYIEHLEQQCKKLKEVIDKTIEYINENKDKYYQDWGQDDGGDDIYLDEYEIKKLLDILKEASE